MALTVADIIRHYRFSFNGNWLFPINLIAIIIFTALLCKCGQHSENEKIELPSLIITKKKEAYLNNS